MRSFPARLLNTEVVCVIQWNCFSTQVACGEILWNSAWLYFKFSGDVGFVPGSSLVDIVGDAEGYAAQSIYSKVSKVHVT